MNDLINFWREASLDGPRYVHPSDWAILKNMKREHKPIHNIADYASALENGQLEPSKFHLTLLPQPFIGNIVSAKVVILLLNPGVHPSDFKLEQENLNFRQYHCGGLRTGQSDHIFLDPNLAWTSGFSWWDKQLRDIAKIIANEKFDGHYGQTLNFLKQNIAVLELVPYHSQVFGGPTNLPSAKIARQAAHEIAANPNRTIIVTRQVKTWDLPDQSNIIKYTAGQSRGASLGPNSPGGTAILKSFGISPHRND